MSDASHCNRIRLDIFRKRHAAITCITQMMNVRTGHLFTDLFHGGNHPFQIAERDVMHFLRAFGIAKGSLIVPPDGMVDLPSNIVPVGFSAPYSEVFSVYSMFRGGDILLSAGNAAYSIQNAALYNPLVYLFCVIGIAAGDFFSDSFYVLITMGRLLNALGCTLMIYLAIRMIPRGKELLCLISLFPINLQRAFSSVLDFSYADSVL